MCEGTKSSIRVGSASVKSYLSEVSLSVCTKVSIYYHLHNTRIVSSHTPQKEFVTNLTTCFYNVAASGQPVEGQSYSLTCEVRGDESLTVTGRFQWDAVQG